MYMVNEPITRELCGLMSDWMTTIYFLQCKPGLNIQHELRDINLSINSSSS
jgi:hypothetical protein